MKIKYATLIVTLLISVNANATDRIEADEFTEIALLEANNPSSGKVIPADFDSLYRVALSKNESIKLSGKINNAETPDLDDSTEARFQVKYSMSF